jgi:F-type H+-transporting ATPase subunit epsilon
MADKIQLEIVTPKGKALDLPVDEVTAPSVEGEFGVLPGHLPLLAALRVGLVSYRTGGDTKRVAIGPGFAEAGPDRLTILTDEFQEKDKVDPVVVRKDIHDVQAQIAKLEGQPAEADGPEKAELRVLITRENWLAAQLELYGDPPPATTRPHEEFGPPAPPDEDQVPTDDDDAEARGATVTTDASAPVKARPSSEAKN